MKIAERIDEVIKDKGLNRHRLAKIIGVPPTTLQSALDRGNGIRYEMLVKIANALSMSTAELLGVKLQTIDNDAADKVLSPVLDSFEIYNFPVIDVRDISSIAEGDLLTADYKMLSQYYEKLNHDARMIVAGLAKMLAANEHNCLDADVANTIYLIRHAEEE